MSRIHWQEPNLARAPFVNERPVRRLAATLWVLFAIIGGLAAWQSVASRQSTGDRLAELLRLNTETAAARERSIALDRELRASDLPAQNERTAFLNRRLAERAFSWSRLLERVTEVMPRGVRLVRLSPEGFASEKRRAGTPARTAATTRVELRVSGEAEETEALLEFVDRLFQHPAFDQPNLSRESELKDTRIQFELAVAYLPEAGTEAPAAAASVVTTGMPSAPAAAGSASQTNAASGAVPPTAGAAPARAGQAPAAVATGDRPAPSGKPLAGSPAVRTVPTARTGAAPSAWGGGANVAQDEPATDSEDPRASASSGAGGRSAGAPSGAVPARNGSVRPGGPDPQSPATGSGARFPANVMPTPLRPYASTTGGGR